MSIANKLTYLEETKGLIKEKLNDLGAEITDDTFREYVEKLEEIYRNYPKTIFRGSDITLPIAKKEKIEIFPIGNTTQNVGVSPDNPQPIKIVTGNNTVKIGGKNLWHPNVSFPLRPSLSSYNGTIDYDEETQVYTMNGTFGPEFFKIFLGAFDEFVAGDKILMKIEKISGTIDQSFMVGGYNNSGKTTSWVGVVSLSPSQTSNVKVETLTRDGMTYAMIWTSFNNNTTTADNFKFRVLFAKTDDTATPFEPYIEPIEKELNLRGDDYNYNLMKDDYITEDCVIHHKRKKVDLSILNWSVASTNMYYASLSNAKIPSSDNINPLFFAEKYISSSRNGIGSGKICISQTSNLLCYDATGKPTGILEYELIAEETEIIPNTIQLYNQIKELYSMMTTGETITIKTESEEENAQLNLEIRTL